MKEKILQIKNYFDELKKDLTTEEAIENARLRFLGKKGEITSIMPMLRDVPNEQKREMGQLVNQIKDEIETYLKEAKTILETEKLEKMINNTERIDITLPTVNFVGSLHPRTIVQKEVMEVFESMGFTIEDGFEIETEYNNFDAVNVPHNHPARDMQDTFWLTNGQLLKTHTSASQNRIIKKYKGPLKAIFPGRCFRNEALDNGHENTFFQIEGMVIDKNISISNLIYFMKEMLSYVLKKEINVRLRPGFFPFVEPGFELDVSCPFCGGKGCPTCKGSGWIELCPCGLIHPNVLKEGGLNPEEYNGFAFGLGLDRLVMIKYGVNDIRLFNSANVKALKQFGIK